MKVDAGRLNETLEICIQAAEKKKAIDAEWGPRATSYAQGLIDAYLDIRDRVYKTKDYETAKRRAEKV